MNTIPGVDDDRRLGNTRIGKACAGVFNSSVIDIRPKPTDSSNLPCQVESPFVADTGTNTKEQVELCPFLRRLEVGSKLVAATPRWACNNMCCDNRHGYTSSHSQSTSRLDGGESCRSHQ